MFDIDTKVAVDEAAKAIAPQLAELEKLLTAINKLIASIPANLEEYELTISLRKKGPQ